MTHTLVNTGPGLSPIVPSHYQNISSYVEQRSSSDSNFNGFAPGIIYQNLSEFISQGSKSIVWL